MMAFYKLYKRRTNFGRMQYLIKRAARPEYYEKLDMEHARRMQKLLQPLYIMNGMIESGGRNFSIDRWRQLEEDYK